MRLIIAKGKPEEIFPKLFKYHKIEILTYEKETVEPYGKERDLKIYELCQSAGVPTKTYATHTLFD